MSGKKTDKTVVVALEGIDGSGKGKQTEEVRAALAADGYKVAVLDFPVYNSFFGKEIGVLLSGEHEVNAGTVDAKSMSLWFALDRHAAFQDFNKSEYDYVLLNRSTLSSVVYQSIRLEEEQRDEFVKWVFELEYRQLAVLEPDIYLVFDVSEDISAANVAKKGRREYLTASHDVYERSEGFMGEVRKQYLKLAQEMPHIKLIQCLDGQGNMKSVSEITQLALRLIYQ